MAATRCGDYLQYLYLTFLGFQQSLRFRLLANYLRRDSGLYAGARILEVEGDINLLNSRLDTHWLDSALVNSIYSTKYYPVNKVIH